MNGNELADILRYSGGEWRPGEPLPKEWWRTDFPYRQAELRGYRMSPEEARISLARGTARTRPTTMGQELADILRSDAYAKLSPTDKLKVLKLKQEYETSERERVKEEQERGEEAKKAVEEERRARELHELELKRQRYAIAESGEKAPRVFPTSRVLGYIDATKRGQWTTAELIAVLMGEGMPEEQAKGIALQIPKPLSEEQKRAKRQAELERDTYYRERAKEREAEIEEYREETRQEAKRKRITNYFDATQRGNWTKSDLISALKGEDIPSTEISSLTAHIPSEAEEEAEKKRGYAEAEKRTLAFLNKLEEQEKERKARNATIYEERRQAARPLSKAKEIELREAETRAKSAEEARLQAYFAPGEAERKERLALDKARKARNDAIYEERRGNAREAARKQREAEEAEEEARLARIAQIDQLGRELKKEKELKEKARLERESAIYEKVRGNIKLALEKEAEAEKAEEEARMLRIDEIDKTAEEDQTEKQKEEKARLEEEREIYATTRGTIQEAITREEEKEEKLKEAREERLKEIEKLGRELADKSYKRKREKIEYDDERADIERKYQDNKDKTLRDYRITVLEKTYNWIKLLDDMGFDNEDLIKVVPEFLSILDVNKKDEQELMRAFGVMGKVAAKNEEEITQKLEIALDEQCKTIDEEIGREGLTENLENKIEMVSLLQFALDEKKLGHDQAIKKWEDIVARGYWWLKGKDIPFKEVKTQETFKSKMKEVIEEAKIADLMEIAGKVVGDISQKKAQKLVDDSKKKKVAEIAIPAGLEEAITGLTDTNSNRIIEAYKSIFNTKTGAITEPGITDRERAIRFVCGMKDDERGRENLPVNMTDREYLLALLQEPRLTQKIRGWLVWKRFDPTLWEGVQNEAAVVGNLIMSRAEETKPEGILDKIGLGFLGVVGGVPALTMAAGEAVKEWWRRGKEKKEKKPSGDIREDLREIVRTHPGIKGKEAAIYLKNKGWTDEEIRSLGGGR